VSFIDNDDDELEPKKVPHYAPQEVDEEDDETVSDPHEEGGEEDGGSETEGRQSGEGEEALPDAEPDGRVGFKGGRASRAVIAAKQAAKEAREEAARLRQEFEDFRRSSMERQSQPDPEAERARVALMEPEERINYFREQDKRELSAQIRRMEMNYADQTDRAQFQTRVATNPKLGRFQDRVEAIYQENKRTMSARGGTPPDRDTILRWVIGDEALKNPGSTGKPTKLSRQTTKAVSSRGDVPSGGRREISEEERLSKYTF
jgi:hypothetical protein